MKKIQRSGGRLGEDQERREAIHSVNIFKHLLHARLREYKSEQNKTLSKKDRRGGKGWGKVG